MKTKDRTLLTIGRTQSIFYLSILRIKVFVPDLSPFFQNEDKTLTLDYEGAHSCVDTT